MVVQERHCSAKDVYDRISSSFIINAAHNYTEKINYVSRIFLASHRIPSSGGTHWPLHQRSEAPLHRPESSLNYCPYLCFKIVFLIILSIKNARTKIKSEQYRHSQTLTFRNELYFNEAYRKLNCMGQQGVAAEILKIFMGSQEYHLATWLHLELIIIVRNSRIDQKFTGIVINHTAVPCQLSVIENNKNVICEQPICEFF